MIKRLAVVASLLLACDGAQTYTTTVELLDIEPTGDAANPSQVTFEMRYVDCPGDSRRVLRGDKELAQCVKVFKEGDKVKAVINSRWSSERGGYRSEVTKLGDCAVKQDPKDEANYEIVQACTDVKMSGAVVGVRCDRTRTKALVEKCPFLRRN